MRKSFVPLVSCLALCLVHTEPQSSPKYQMWTIWKSLQRKVYVHRRKTEWLPDLLSTFVSLPSSKEAQGSLQDHLPLISPNFICTTILRDRLDRETVSGPSGRAGTWPLIFLVKFTILFPTSIGSSVFRWCWNSLFATDDINNEAIFFVTENSFCLKQQRGYLKLALLDFEHSKNNSYYSQAIYMDSPCLHSDKKSIHLCNASLFIQLGWNFTW